jgi:hypothetical protein
MKTDKKIHYNVGQVDVEVNLSHMNKLRVLHMTMNNWGKNNGHELESEWTSLDAPRSRLYEADLHKVEELVDEGNVYGEQEFLTKEQMVSMNVLFKTYGGIRKAPEDEVQHFNTFKFEDSLWDNVTFVTPNNTKK